MPTVTDFTSLLSGDSWNGLEISGKAAVVTYSFATAASPDDAPYMGPALSTFQAMTATQKDDIRAALAEWAAASGLQFVEVPAGASDISFAGYDFSTSYYNGKDGVANYPFGDWNYYSYPNFLDSGFPGAGHVMLNTDSVSAGHFNHGLLLHEIGHALGLKHPTEDFHNYASGVDHDQVLDNDGHTSTVMTQASNGPQSLQALDIAAIQAIYGTQAQDGNEYKSWSYDSVHNRFTFSALNAGGVTRGSSVGDLIKGSNSNDVLLGLGGNDNIYAYGGTDKLFGGSGDDGLHAGTGADTMYGGKGNDSYYVGDPTLATIIEFANEGTDTVFSDVSYVLGPNIENLTLTGSGNINGTGNELANILTGNGSANVLDGSTGADRMFGGAGNDTYVVDNTGDRAYEYHTAGGDEGGTDTVNASVSYALAAFIENLTLTGPATINGAGNAQDNVIRGNASNNTLDGKAGADTVYGGGGNDLYYVDNVNDVVSEQTVNGVDDGGTDRIISSVTYALGAFVENLTLTGMDNVAALGNGMSNTLIGNAGNNVLMGGAGIDYLTGGVGNDSFVFSHYGVDNGIDRIKDFAPGQDLLSFTAADYGFAGGHVLQANELSTTGAAVDTNPQFVYNTVSHMLYWDSNGSLSGGLHSLAVFDNGTLLSITDFIFT